jgi:hypothetical protein
MYAKSVLGRDSKKDSERKLYLAKPRREGEKKSNNLRILSVFFSLLN